MNNTSVDADLLKLDLRNSVRNNKYGYDEPVLDRREDDTHLINYERENEQGYKNSVGRNADLEHATTQEILMQPEMRLLLQERQQEKAKLTAVHMDKPQSTHLSERELLMKRFPWMAESLKSAWEDLEKEKVKKGIGRLKSALNMQPSKHTYITSGREGLLKGRKKQSKFPILKDKDENESEDGAKVVFSNNIPLLVYNKHVDRCIRIGGDNKPTEKDNLEALYRAINFNPELKRLTLDIADLLHPEKDRPLTIALAYISANTLHNPNVLSDDMMRFSYKKELMIRAICLEIEKRLLRQRTRRGEREERQRKQDEAIQKQKEEEEARGRDFITAKRLLEESKQVNTDLLTQYEKNQERHRRIRLRTKSIPTSKRADVQVKQRRIPAKQTASYQP